MNRFLELLTLFLAVAPLVAHAQRDEPIDGFLPREFRAGRDVMPYRLYVPAGYDAAQRYPLVIWLHGGGGAGVDNVNQITGDQIAGTRTWTKPENQAKYPAFVLAPQSPRAWVGLGAKPVPIVIRILDALQREYSLDPARIYVAGQSSGGYGVWNAITDYPDRFAAAIAICGGGNPARAPRAAKMPIWAFHGDVDDVIPVMGSREMIAAIRRAGGTPRYTEYKGAGHDIWTRALAEPGLVDWLFAQHR